MSSFDELRGKLKDQPTVVVVGPPKKIPNILSAIHYQASKDEAPEDTFWHIRTVPDPILRRVCKRVDVVDDSIRELVASMKQYIYDHKDDAMSPLSLSAPQFGVLVQVTVFCLNSAYREMSGIIELINPELVSVKKQRLMEETCMSIPGKKYIVERARMVKVRGTNLSGHNRTYKATDLTAQMFQHEIGHLRGILIDKIGTLATR